MKRELTKEEIFDRLYEEHGLDVYHACLHLTKDEYLAQEMGQQAFLNFYENYETTQPECVKGYIIRIARNLIYNYYRHAKYEVLSSGEDEDEPKSEPATESVEEKYFHQKQRESERQLGAEILADLKASHEGWYEILHRMYCLEQDHDEIAKELRISKEVLYSRMYRAKSWVRKNYGKEFENL